MPRENHNAVETNDTITDMFSRLGMGEDSPLIAHARKLQNMRVNGVRIGDLRASLQKPNQPRVTESYQTAEMTADMLVSLGFDDTTASVVRRAEGQPPDLEILFTEPEKRVYAEFSRVCYRADEAMDALAMEIDHALKELPTHDAVMQKALQNFSIHIDFCARLEDNRPAASGVVAEIRDFICTAPLAEQYSAFDRTPFDGKYPLLQRLQATYRRSDSAWIGGNFVRSKRPDLGVQSLHDAVQERILAKAGKGYPVEPLWLLLSVSETWSESVAAFFERVKNRSIVLTTSGFEQIIIGVTGHAVFLLPFGETAT